MLKIEAWYSTDKGLVRSGNEDSCLLNVDLGLFVVADGMGGHQGGEIASSMAVETFEEIIFQAKSKSMSARELIQNAYLESSARIYDLAANQRPELMGMGTTMVSALLKDDRLYIGNVGDSRCYIYRFPHIWQATEDHSAVHEVMRANSISEEEAKKITGRNVITRSVGYQREVYPDVVEWELQGDEAFLLCSDGLYTMVEDDEILRIMSEAPAAQVAQMCVDKALENGGEDNVTVMYFRFQREKS